MLGLKGCDYALEADHWARTIGNELSGLKSEPQRWKPTTYGELWVGYRAVWSLIVKNLFRLGEREQQFAIGILLKRARGLIFRTKLWDTVLETIVDLSSRPYVKRKDLIKAIERILHYDQTKLSSDIISRLLEIRELLVGRDFPSLVRRYVGMDVIEDRLHKDGTQTDTRQQMLRELAQKAVANPDLLKPELHWLVTNEAENGYPFGYELGKADVHLLLFERIAQAQRQCEANCSLFFLSGYGRALNEKASVAWEKYLEDLSKATTFIQWLPELVWRSGSTSERIIDLIDRLVEGKRIGIANLERFAYGSGREQIKAETFVRWITLLLKDGAPTSISSALELFYSSQVRKEDASDSAFRADLALSLLTHPTWFQPRGNREHTLEEYNWIEIAKTLVERHPERALELSAVLLSKFGTEGSIVESAFSQGVEVLYKIAEKFPDEFWDQLKAYLDPPIDIRAFQFRHWLRGEVDEAPSPLPLIPPQKLWDWVDENVEARAWNLSGMVPKAWFDEDEGRVCLARQVLVRYGSRKDVRSEMKNSFMSGSWWGPESAHLTDQKDFLLSIKKKDPDKNVRRWIDEYVADLKQYIDSAKIREERGF